MVAGSSQLMLELYSFAALWDNGNLDFEKTMKKIIKIENLSRHFPNDQEEGDMAQRRRGALRRSF